MRGKLCRGNICAAVANLESGSIILEVVAKDSMIVAEEPQAATCADKEVAVNQTPIPMA